MKRALLAGVIVTILVVAAPARAWEPPPALVVLMDGVSLPALLRDPQLRALASHGGAALMNGRVSAVDETQLVIDSRDTTPAPVTAHGIHLRHGSPGVAAEAVSAWLDGRTGALADQPVLVMVVSVSPSAATAADGDELGAVIAAWGDPDELLEAMGEPRALTSDSTRRAGVVATVDPAATVAAWLGAPSDAGAPIEPTDEPVPLGLYERYLQQRRLAVPVAAASWSLMGVAGLAGVAALRWRRRVSARVLAIAAALAATLPWLALGLLLVGHLPSLTVWTVAPFLVGVMAAGVAAGRWVADRRGILVALGATGIVILVALAFEAAAGWPAAITPLAGGGQLDGGRFFGMPNVEIGLVLGAALYVCQRIPTVWGVALLTTCALVTGSPWTGSNLGAAITLFAAGGIWLGIRASRPWWLTALLTAATIAAGIAVMAVMHQYLTARPTHVTAFLEQGGGIAGALDRLVDRLGVGLDLLADNPFAILPVVGTLVLLIVVLRPPPSIALSFQGRDAWRDAVLVIVLGSIVAYLANDTGAAALGFGFGFALSGLLDVSLTTAREMMRR